MDGVDRRDAGPGQALDQGGLIGPLEALPAAQLSGEANGGEGLEKGEEGSPHEARLLARDDTREMLDSLLLHIGTAYETEAWGQARKFIVLDVINDLLTLTLRSSLLHLMSSD